MKMLNIFADAKFGDRYYLPNEEIAIYCYHRKGFYVCMIETSPNNIAFYDFTEDGTEVKGRYYIVKKLLV